MILIVEGNAPGRVAQGKTGADAFLRTFMALGEDYRDYFIRNLHDALSGHSSNSVAEAVR